jgi:hypothetical protein
MDTSLTLQGVDHPAFTALQSEFANVSGGPPKGLPPDRGIELNLETAGILSTSLTVDGFSPSPSAMLPLLSLPGSRTADYYDFRGLNAITEPCVEPLPHIDALLEETCGTQWFTNFDLVQGYQQVCIRKAYWWETSFLSQLRHFEWKVIPFGLQGPPRSLCWS